MRTLIYTLALRLIRNYFPEVWDFWKVWRVRAGRLTGGEGRSAVESESEGDRCRGGEGGRRIDPLPWWGWGRRWWGGQRRGGSYRLRTASREVTCRLLAAECAPSNTRVLSLSAVRRYHRAFLRRPLTSLPPSHLSASLSCHFDVKVRLSYQH